MAQNETAGNHFLRETTAQLVRRQESLRRRREVLEKESTKPPVMRFGTNSPPRSRSATTLSPTPRPASQPPSTRLHVEEMSDHSCDSKRSVVSAYQRERAPMHFSLSYRPSPVPSLCRASAKCSPVPGQSRMPAKPTRRTSRTPFGGPSSRLDRFTDHVNNTQHPLESVSIKRSKRSQMTSAKRVRSSARTPSPAPPVVRGRREHTTLPNRHKGVVDVPVTIHVPREKSASVSRPLEPLVLPPLTKLPGTTPVSDVGNSQNETKVEERESRAIPMVPVEGTECPRRVPSPSQQLIEFTMPRYSATNSAVDALSFTISPHRNAGLLTEFPTPRPVSRLSLCLSPPPADSGVARMVPRRTVSGMSNPVDNSVSLSASPTPTPDKVLLSLTTCNANHCCGRTAISRECQDADEPVAHESGRLSPSPVPTTDNLIHSVQASADKRKCDCERPAPATKSRTNHGEAAEDTPVFSPSPNQSDAFPRDMIDNGRRAAHRPSPVSLPSATVSEAAVPTFHPYSPSPWPTTEQIITSIESLRENKTKNAVREDESKSCEHNCEINPAEPESKCRMVSPMPSHVDVDSSTLASEEKRRRRPYSPTQLRTSLGEELPEHADRFCKTHAKDACTSPSSVAEEGIPSDSERCKMNLFPPPPVEMISVASKSASTDTVSASMNKMHLLEGANASVFDHRSQDSSTPGVDHVAPSPAALKSVRHSVSDAPTSHSSEVPKCDTSYDPVPQTHAADPGLCSTEVKYASQHGSTATDAKMRAGSLAGGEHQQRDMASSASTAVSSHGHDPAGDSCRDAFGIRLEAEGVKMSEKDAICDQTSLTPEPNGNGTQMRVVSVECASDRINAAPASPSFTEGTANSAMFYECVSGTSSTSLSSTAHLPPQFFELQAAVKAISEGRSLPTGPSPSSLLRKEVKHTRRTGFQSKGVREEKSPLLCGFRQAQEAPSVRPVLQEETPSSMGHVNTRRRSITLLGYDSERSYDAAIQSPHKPLREVTLSPARHVSIPLSRGVSPVTVGRPATVDEVARSPAQNRDKQVVATLEHHVRVADRVNSFPSEGCSPLPRPVTLSSRMAHTAGRVLRTSMCGGARASGTDSVTLAPAGVASYLPVRSDRLCGPGAPPISFSPQEGRSTPYPRVSLKSIELDLADSDESLNGLPEDDTLSTRSLHQTLIVSVHDNAVLRTTHELSSSRKRERSAETMEDAVPGDDGATPEISSRLSKAARKSQVEQLLEMLPPDVIQSISNATPSDKACSTSHSSHSPQTIQCLSTVTTPSPGGAVVADWNEYSAQQCHTNDPETESRFVSIHTTAVLPGTDEKQPSLTHVTPKSTSDCLRQGRLAPNNQRSASLSSAPLDDDIEVSPMTPTPRASRHGRGSQLVVSTRISAELRSALFREEPTLMSDKSPDDSSLTAKPKLRKKKNRRKGRAKEAMARMPQAPAPKAKQKEVTNQKSVTSAVKAVAKSSLTTPPVKTTKQKKSTKLKKKFMHD